MFFREIEIKSVPSITVENGEVSVTNIKVSDTILTKKKLKKNN